MIDYCFNWAHIVRFWAASWASICMALASALVFRVVLAFRARLARITALVAVYIAFLMTVDRYYIRKHFNFIQSDRNATPPSQ